MCGADEADTAQGQQQRGSPPRVRSRLNLTRLGVSKDGITSACAEQTHPYTAYPRCSVDHLRVCGADRRFICTVDDTTGSPPRVRSRPTRRGTTTTLYRITSACAEQTVALGVVPFLGGDHLRVCGADSCILLCSEPAEWRRIFDLRTA